ncbi:phospholipase A2 inhibitor and Ly6/PLAUR domain-containing protein-like [Emys orbicularis]|uniref:phospholipase A2 inhibitor and Ly6/PLAUR domain-containing protein-like n=1 Tax=Emys orbicularis TaxID=82168 RepID=UPI0031FCC6CF
MVSFILCLLPALLATSAQAQTVTCHQCSGSAESCLPADGTCSVGTAKGGCFTMAEENTLHGTKTTLFSKGCLSDYNSGIKVPITFTGGNGKYLKINTTRCNDADNCNSALLEVPKENTTTNGRQCPTCLSLNANTCDSQITPCTGNEIYCIDFVGEIQKGTPAVKSPFAAKGCATESVQGIKTGDTLVSAGYTFTFTKVTASPAEKTPTSTKPPTTTKPTQATTSGASPALGKFSFALGLTGLLLVKLLS